MIWPAAWISSRAAVELQEGLLPAPASSASGISVNGRRMLDAIDGLPSEEREVFDLIRIQGITQTEAAEVLGVSVMTVKRRLKRGLLILTEAVGDLRPCEQTATASPNGGAPLPDGGGS